MKVHSEGQVGPDKPGLIRRFVENRLIGNFDSEDFSPAWRKKFSHAPTWCDADMSLQQIRRGEARGNRIALYARAFFQLWLFRIGCFVQRYAWSTVLVSMILYTLCCSGLKEVIIETDIVKLWVSQGGRLNEELNFLANVQAHANRIKRELPINATIGAPTTQAPQRRGPEIPKENGLGGGFQVVIQTPSYQGEDVLTKEALLRHTALMEEIANYEVHMWGESWKLSDICFKPPGPSFNSGPLAGLMSKLLDKIIPCIWITPIDCYFEGAKPLGPSPPLNLGPEIAGFISSLPPGNVTWKNLNPTSVIKEVGQLFDLGPIGNFFERAGIDGAYLDRPCIDPLDSECPPSSPNYFDRCGAYKKFQTWNMAKNMDEQVKLERKIVQKEDKKTDVAESILNDLFGKKRRKRATDGENEKKAKLSGKKDEDYYAYEDDADYNIDGIGNFTSKKKVVVDTSCLEYGESLLAWMQANPDRLGEFLTETEMPQYPDYGKVMTGGCKGFGKKIMEWPEDLIIGGIKRDGNRLKSAEALQSVFLVSSPFDVYLRVKEDKSDSHPALNRAQWNPYMAQEVIVAWQRNFTKKIYGHEANFKTEGHRVFHPLASTSIADMLEEFSQFNYVIIIVGYVLMVIYAAFTQARIDGRWLAIQSNVMIAIVGVILVTFSSICGLGLATTLGINFNAATTQVVPFLSLGLGIDDMFLLLHNYDEIINICNKNEIGVLLKETGMSVMVTSINNILAFISGYVLPIPALRSFCSQTAILLAFNLVFLMFIFPAIIGLDLRRQRAGKRDFLICSRGNDDNLAPSDSIPSNVSNMSSKAELASYDVNTTTEFKRHEPWYTVGGFLKNIYIPALKKPIVKAAVILATVAAVILGLYGMYTSTLGLELADVLPESTPPAAFLRAREKYFSFYPMFAVLRGETIDVPHQQQLIEEYREELGKSKFMIKAEGKLQPYWMSMLRVWLKSLDTALEKEIAAGKINITNGQPIKVNGEKPAPEAMIAARLLCSFGTTYNCDGRLGKMKLVNEHDVIQPDAFYNYLTGWYNVDNMMYYVSQASFFPLPPGWAYDESRIEVVPPASRLLYSQIPYYQNDLVDTPAIVKMIEEIRGISEEFTDRGLPNFPSGIAFTFWEQYLSLRWNLLMAICIIAFAVFTVISVLMFNPLAAAMVMIIVVVITIELGGFMGIMGIKMNPISAVTLICAVGIGVEFTAHVVLAFLTALGTVNDRLESCLQHMFVPVFHGAISTFLGVVMLVFSEFDFVVKYFFNTMTVLVLLGVFNGLTLLPVLLTLFGPDSELTPTSGESSLPAPPPLRQQLSGKDIYSEDGLKRRKPNGSSEVEMDSRASVFRPTTEDASKMK
ncbi:unnamed protein product [Caenorhabditis auriculariae]|uniref:SSD domain-containing protein n=1 Tax=Caenorhabditis auriculariae TaxID=2777116 RepID=A0A8S1HDS5_9PELO|nr:unnamed protein product [Caenorhabditis auriculariae]